MRLHRLRPAARALVTAGFALLLLAAAATSAANRSHAPSPWFSHHYPQDPFTFERPKIGGAAPRASHSNTVSGAIRIRSLADLAALLPSETLRRVGRDTWRVAAPIDLTRGATLDLERVSLQIGPGAFLQARAGGSLLLSHSTVEGVTMGGAPAVGPTSDRGFLVARDGGRLVLRYDTITNLGHLATVAYGISLRDPTPGSLVFGSTIEGDYFGIFLSHASDVSITDNRVLDSSIYGIDPYGSSTNLLIARNDVARSGVHGIILANHVTTTRVVDNSVVDVRGHGIVLFENSNDNIVRGNRISHAFDGLVLTSSSRNRLVGNTVSGVERFGVRVSQRSSSNELIRNAFSHALLAVYLYGGATANSVLASTFSKNGENVRVRADAPSNVVRPRPALSEFR